MDFERTFCRLPGDMPKHRRRFVAVHQLARMHDALVLSETHSNEGSIGFPRRELLAHRVGASHLTDGSGGISLLIGPGLLHSAPHLEFFVIAVGRVLGCCIVHEGGELVVVGVHFVPRSLDERCSLLEEIRHGLSRSDVGGELIGGGLNSVVEGEGRFRITAGTLVNAVELAERLFPETFGTRLAELAQPDYARLGMWDGAPHVAHAPVFAAVGSARPVRPSIPKCWSCQRQHFSRPRPASEPRKSPGLLVAAGPSSGDACVPCDVFVMDWASVLASSCLLSRSCFSHIWMRHCLVVMTCL